MKPLAVASRRRVIIVFFPKDRTESFRLNDAADLPDHSTVAAHINGQLADVLNLPLHKGRYPSSSAGPPGFRAGKRNYMRASRQLAAQAREIVLKIQVALAPQPPEQRRTSWMRTFGVGQQHRPDRRDARPRGHEQQVARRIVPQIKRSEEHTSELQ